MTWYCDLSRSLATLKPPHPDPTITTLGREEEEEERLLLRIRMTAGDRAGSSILTRSRALACLERAVVCMEGKQENQLIAGGSSLHLPADEIFPETPSQRSDTLLKRKAKRS